MIALFAVTRTYSGGSESIPAVESMAGRVGGLQFRDEEVGHADAKVEWRHRGRSSLLVIGVRHCKPKHSRHAAPHQTLGPCDYKVKYHDVSL